MDGVETDIADGPKEPVNIGSDAMLVEETNEIIGGMETAITDAPKEPVDNGSDAMLVEETMEVMDDIETNKGTISSRHNKPKKVNTEVILKDYVCTAEDFAIIESIMNAPRNTNFVKIGDALLSNDDLKCLNSDDGFLPDDVMNAYIYCMRECDHLLDRAGGKVYMDKTFVSGQLKGKKVYRHIINQAHLYLKYDMVFLPVNITKTHWYLAVINAKKRLIQVLDSIGIGMSRSGLTDMLRGLEKHLKIASQTKGFEKGDKWQDLNVTTWAIEEHIQNPVQTDGASCGLFTLNFMEYWTGDVLSDYVTQEDMKAFRRKLIVILHDSQLNKIRGSPIYDQTKDEQNGSDSDVIILPSVDGKHPRDVTKENIPLPVCIMTNKPHELVDEICKYIMSIDDATCLEKEWIRSSKPYPLGLTLKQIQGILRMDQPMDKDCFNMAVRIVACDEIQLFIEPPVHYMDLRFCSAIIDGTRGKDWRKKPDVEELATLLHGWPGVEHDISSCNMILLPHVSLGNFMLFTINKKKPRVYILDSYSEPLSEERYQLKLQRCSFYLNDALEKAQPGWNSDIYFWPRKYPHSIPIPTSSDRNLLGYLVFSYMLSWDGERFVHPVCTDGYKLRKKFLIRMLKYYANEVMDNIPDVVRGYLSRVKGEWLSE